MPKISSSQAKIVMSPTNIADIDKLSLAQPVADLDNVSTISVPRLRPFDRAVADVSPHTLPVENKTKASPFSPKIPLHIQIWANEARKTFSADDTPTMTFGSPSNTDPDHTRRIMSASAAVEFVDNLSSDDSETVERVKRSASLRNSIDDASLDSTTSPFESGKPGRQYSWRNPRPRRNTRRSWSSRQNSTGGNESDPDSPAARFLARFNSRGGDISEPDPDDEGQEVADYVMGSALGYGGFSTVRKAHTIVDGRKVTHAVKIVRKSQSEQAQADLDHELTVWRCVVPSHPHILRLISVHETDFAFFCFMEYANLGSVFDAVVYKQRINTLTESISTSVKLRWVWELCSAIRFLHQDLRIVHGDIKPENCLLHIQEEIVDDIASGVLAGGRSIERAKLLLADFGMAQFMPTETSDQSSVGCDSTLLDQTIEPGSRSVSPSETSEPFMTSSISSCASQSTELDLTGSVPFLPPELLVPRDSTTPQPVSSKQDIWAIGVFTYTLFTSILPFAHSFLPKLQQLILVGDWDVDTLRQSCPTEFADKIVKFVEVCLTMDPEQRPDIGSLMRSDVFERVEKDC
ncbi:kinase-like domain-containing protein [Lipomyces oligophaga]|uniref:kinase-like domain-containing protein n=1 Tax=Lipomyces oligophaga TaxID=45792 RepID=UPI0034CF161D